MSFREKSAWFMGALMTVAGLYYLRLALQASDALGGGAPPIAVVAPYVLLVVVGSIVIQTILAVLAPKEANAPADEREGPLLDRAGHWSGYVLAVGALAGLWNFMVHGDGQLMFHIVVGALIVSQIAEYAFQIVLLRRGG
jgi:hypothetical protein